MLYRTYGKGRHPAGLNYGDCFSYALSSIRGEPLLYKGEDFGKTDVKSALERFINDERQSLGVQRCTETTAEDTLRDA